jgi:hypothetical protein
MPAPKARDARAVGLAEQPVDRGENVDAGGRIERHVDVVFREQQFDLGATGDDPLRAVAGEPINDLQIAATAIFANAAVDELVVDDPVHGLSVLVGRHDGLDPVVLERGTVEVLLHREPRAEQTVPFEPVGDDALGCRVGDVEEGDRDRGFDGISDTVHRVRAQQEALRARHFEALCRVGEQPGRLVPVIAFLEFDDTGEIGGPHQKLG